MSKISIIVSSEKIDKLLEAGILASTSSAMNWDAELFFTFWGLLAVKKGFEAKKVSSDYSEYEDMLKKNMKSGSIPEWRELLIKAKESGNVKFFACSTTLGMFGIDKENLEEFVDDIVGAATFLSKAKESDINLFIS
ncbi:MAG: DsrE/DsrF/DrsH-like family protein [Candidatus Bathyarchaeota archaeon]|nr:DsrE/DsrF/DrsH-like family protein [Candidatus Bathyarchaeota archaeon]